MTELGALSISLRDAGDEPIYEPLPGDSPIWHQSIVTATFAEDSDPEALEQMLAAKLPLELVHTLARDSFQDRDWDQAYRDHFKPIQCAPKLWIVPSWTEPPDPDATNVCLDPGLAFGTGGHPTTALCLAWLAKQGLDGQELIDFGCGSGILAIAAIKLGASHVLAVDIDPQALSACTSNMTANAIAMERIRMCLPGAVGKIKTDLLMANILAGPLLNLLPQFAELVRPGGNILLSGILKSQLNQIQSAYSKKFELQPACFREDWVCLSGRRHQQETDV